MIVMKAGGLHLLNGLDELAKGQSATPTNLQGKLWMLVQEQLGACGEHVCRRLLASRQRLVTLYCRQMGDLNSSVDPSLACYACVWLGV